MFGEFELRDVALSVASERQRVEAFLYKNGLRLDPIDTYLGLFDSDDELVGGGGLSGNIIKCVAIDPAHRSMSLANTLISGLRQRAFDEGYRNVLVFTKPENEAVFRSLAFHVVGRSSRAMLLESDPRGISSFAEKLRLLRRKGRNGVAVMNCNPLTRGHLHLIRTASVRVDTLYIILVSENCSAFSYQERCEMVENATADMPNVVVVGGGQYVISGATFPSYFLKSPDEATEAQIDLDLDVFQRYIVLALNIAVRFVGNEPLDPLTHIYNERMKNVLEIEVDEIPRLEIHGEVVAASLVRRQIEECQASKALRYVPEATIPYILSHVAAHSLHSELELTPKPGLVDKHDNGAHRDMDFALMERSIRVLTPYFTELARLGMKLAELSVADVKDVGLCAERAMLAATKGVNTHRGALFSMGLAVTAAAECIKLQGEITPADLQESIKRLAKGFEQPVGTHGGNAVKEYNANGAVASAQSGYARLFAQWLPSYRATGRKDEDKMRLLLLIMSQIDDTNIYYRCGKDTAVTIKNVSLQLLNNFSVLSMMAANEQFVSLNASPGGAADMLALTFFVDSVSCGRRQ